MEYTKEQLKAAYALNLCTVSVSQIIDYNDVTIMEQEYEAILNNLNLEEMPKDEALLKILKQILDTITYFRIEEGDKKFIEKDYQQKMKNAIWSAVPNIGTFIAGGSLFTIAVSLASQVGIGYMNYRKEKAQIDLEHEKELWQLERTAIDQFNGLRRELFDTAWRLSAAHHFPDELRLTERQIHQYDDILMDSDLLRKYYRMDAIKGAFLAYPPFWYYFGSAANEIARSDLNLTKEAREQFRLEAVDHFRQYRKSDEYGLLREDEIKASCALELVDLLDTEKDLDEILELLEEAVRVSGNAKDVLQLAAMTYLKLGEQDRAAELLSQLVNEEYNTVLNAQLLSSIYVHRYAQTGSDKILFHYEVLSNQVGEHFLYPLKKDETLSPLELEEEFITSQKENLLLKYRMVLESFRKKYTISYGKILPAANPMEVLSDLYFDGSEASIAERKYQLRRVFSNEEEGEIYKERLRESEMNYALLDLLNEMFDSLCFLDVLDGSLQSYLARDIEQALAGKRDQINTYMKLIEDNEIDLFGIYKLLELPFDTFVGTFFKNLSACVEYYVASRNEMQDFAIAEDNLVEFCNREELPNPNDIFGSRDNLPAVVEAVPRRRFGAELFGEEQESTKTVLSERNEVKEIFENYRARILINREEAELLTMGNPKIARYFRSNNRLKDNGWLMANTIAVLDDLTKRGDFDLIFLLNGVVPVKKGVPKKLVKYTEIQWIGGKFSHLDIHGVYERPGVDEAMLYQMMQELTPFMREAADSDDSDDNKHPKFKIPFQK